MKEKGQLLSKIMKIVKIYRALPRRRIIMWRKLWREWVLPFLIAVAVSLLLRSFVAEARVIPSGSMEPNIQIRDRVLIDKLFFRLNDLQRGDVVVFWPPDGVVTDYPYIKRIVGLPGDTILIFGEALFVNGEQVDEPYISVQWHDNYGPVTVPSGKLFLMGDNRRASVDSRSWGYAELDEVIGKADWVIWPPWHAGKIKGKR
jgi:signal peptidase I